MKHCVEFVGEGHMEISSTHAMILWHTVPMGQEVCYNFEVCDDADWP